jgi:hypothetical protein
MSKHLMLDLETLDTAPTSCFTQIGWAVFDWAENDVQESGLICIDANDAHVKWGLTISWETLRWWMQQSQVARTNMCQPGIPLKEALLKLAACQNWKSLDGVWSHGASFDIPILDHAWRKVMGGFSPWHHKQVRDTRTIFALTSPVWPNQDGQGHCADADAINQAKALQSCYPRLRKLIPS